MAPAPTDHRMRHRLALERLGIDGIGGIARSTDRQPQRRGEVVVVHAFHEAVNDPRRILVVGIEQDEREQSLARQAQDVGVADLCG